MGMEVTVSPVMDYDWDLLQSRYSDPALSTQRIGSLFSADEWKAWFESYAAAITPFLTQAAAAGATAAVVGSGLDAAFTAQPKSWL